MHRRTIRTPLDLALAMVRAGMLRICTRYQDGSESLPVKAIIIHCHTLSGQPAALHLDSAIQARRIAEKMLKCIRQLREEKP